MKLSHGSGNPQASYLVVGDHMTFTDQQKATPFSDGSGTVLFKLLQDAGILVSDCWFTNVVNAVPTSDSNWYPQKKNEIRAHHEMFLNRHVDRIVVRGVKALQETISLVKPKAIITLGNPPLWALTGNWSALSWRGSQLTSITTNIPLIPTLHPRFIMAQWQHRVSCLNDVKRAWKAVNAPVAQPEWRFILRPSSDTVVRICTQFLERLNSGERLWFDLDLETIGGHISCLGFSWSRTEALCIPFTVNGLHRNYWSSAEEEAIVVMNLYRLFTHPNAAVRWQNGLFDAQYVFRHWHFIPRGRQDTMISHHSMWAGMQKSLAFQAAMYCDYYQYWKEMRGDAAEMKEGA